MIHDIQTTTRQRVVVFFARTVLAASLSLLQACTPVVRPQSARAAAVYAQPSTTPFKIERYPKVDGQYVRYGAEQVQIGPYRMARIDHEDDQAIYVRIYPPVEVSAAGPLAAVAPVATLPSSRIFTLQSFDQGLPRQGQWRNDLTIADLDGDGELDIASTPPRKTLGWPVVFRGNGSGSWQRWAATRFPDLGYDYGSTVAGDLDGDGLTDLGLAMHLRGFTVLRQQARGQFQRSDAGLPQIEQRAEHGQTGTQLLWSRDAGGRPLLVLLSEHLQSRSAPGPRRAVQAFAWDGRQWVGTDEMPAELATAGQATLIHADRSAPGDWILRQSIDGSQIFGLLGGVWSSHRLEGVAEGCELQGAAVADVDNDGLPDVALSCLRLVDARWWSQVQLLRSRLGPLTLHAGPQDQAVRAIRFIHPRGADTAADLALLDKRGALQLLSADGAGGFSRDHLEAVPDWRGGCQGFALHGVDLDHDGHDEIVASFAGEASVFEPGPGCRESGGISVWKVHSTQ